MPAILAAASPGAVLLSYRADNMASTGDWLGPQPFVAGLHARRDSQPAGGTLAFRFLAIKRHDGMGGREGGRERSEVKRKKGKLLEERKE